MIVRLLFFFLYRHYSHVHPLAPQHYLQVVFKPVVADFTLRAYNNAKNRLIAFKPAFMLSVRRNDMEILKNKLGFICDMDGVIYHGNKLLPGVPEFVDWLYKENKNFLFLTNSSERSPKELQQKL